MSEYTPQWQDYDILTNVLSHLLINAERYRSTDESEDAEEDTRYGNSLPSRPLSNSSIHDLLSMSRTCRSFATPSLEALWRFQNSLLPVLKLIPQFTMSSDIRDGWTLDGDIAPSDWDRFNFYARMIREIHLPISLNPGADMENIHESVFCYLLQARTGVFFPSLSVINTGADLRLPLFHSPALKHVELHVKWGPDDMRSNPWASSFIDRAHTSPYLGTIIMNSVVVRPSALRVIFQTPRLQSLGICVTPTFFHNDLPNLINNTASELKFLRVLNLTFKGAYGSVSHLRNGRLELPNLQSLSFNGPVDYMALLCDNIDCIGLRECVYDVTRVKRISRDKEGVFLERIGKRIGVLSSNYLEALGIDMGFHQTFPFVSLDISHFFWLYRLRNLKKLVFGEYLPFNPNDSDLEMMGQSWPRLNVLRIPLSQYAEKRNATPQGVKSLAVHCPHLRELSITFDATDPSSIPVQTEEWILDRSLSPLQTFNANDSPLHADSVEPLSALFKSLFPNLKRLIAVELRSGEMFDSDDEDIVPGLNFGTFQLESNLWARVQKILI